MTDQEIIAMYEGGASLREIAGVLGKSIRRPYRVVKQAGIIRPSHGHVFHKQWRGGRTMHDGYVRVLVSESDPMASMRNNNGYVLEHRLVMARTLGRPLRDTETVHHINGDGFDNRPENLQLRQGNHGKHVVMCCLDCGSRNIGTAPIADTLN